jgi:hypothetical protein
MAHYAFINNQNLVIEVITGRDEDDIENLPEGFENWEDYYITKRPDAVDCLRTSYNTDSNIHKLGGTAFRGNYAGLEFSYDEENNIFMPPQPFPSWTKNVASAQWDCPIPYPDLDNYTAADYIWNENTHIGDNSKGWELIQGLPRDE